MSEIILTWLNDEVQLSKKITNFEKDFANGYLLGELLSKYNQQLNFHDFIDKFSFSSHLFLTLLGTSGLTRSKIIVSSNPL